MKTLLCILSMVLSVPARADERYDHRGALGVLISMTGEYKSAATLKATSDKEGFRGGAELGMTYAIGSDGNEIKAALRSIFGGVTAGCSDTGSCAPVDLSLYLGYRGYFDLGQWKTFYDFDLAQHVVPHLGPSSANGQIYTIGPRIGLGVQLDFLPIAGAFLILEGQIGFGDGLRYGAGVMLGIQLRSYLLE